MPAPPFELRPIVAEDLEVITAINAECVPEVGAADAPRLASIVAEAQCATAAVVEGTVVGFLLGLGPGAAYDSVNYQWFAARHADFAYVDRIALSESARGLGIGPALYEHYETISRAADATVLCAEVNVEPPNPRSMRFHETFGFVAVAETEPKGTPDYRVAMVEKALR